MESNDKLYVPLRRGSLSNSDDDFERGLHIRPRTKRSILLWRGFVTLLLISMNVLAFLAFKNGPKSGPIALEQMPSDYGKASGASAQNFMLMCSLARVDELPTTYTRFDWWTEYSDKNETEVDAKWDAINPAHGFVAMDRQWTKENHWPDSMHLPQDDSKNVYLLEAYHLIHCLVCETPRL